MTRIAQSFKQMSLPANATAILGRACASTIQTVWSNTLLRPWLDVFHRNHMPPAISKVIFVEKAGSFFPSDSSESGASIVFHPIFKFWIWLAIMRGADDELMKVIVLPSHNNLKHLMQTQKRSLTRNHDLAPDRWFNVSKTNMQLIDYVG